MESNEAVLQAKKAEQRKHRAIMFGEEFHEKSEMYSEFVNALFERLDPVQMAVIHEFRERIEEYERCVAKIKLNGLSVQECIDEYASFKEQEERSAS